MLFTARELGYLNTVINKLNEMPTHDDYYIHVELREEGTHTKVAEFSDEFARDDWYVEFEEPEPEKTEEQKVFEGLLDGVKEAQYQKAAAKADEGVDFHGARADDDGMPPVQEIIKDEDAEKFQIAQPHYPTDKPAKF